MNAERVPVSGTYPVIVDPRGHVVIPVELREKLHLEPGSPLILVDTPHGVIMATRDQLKQLVRADLQGLDLVNELLTERRKLDRSRCQSAD